MDAGCGTRPPGHATGVVGEASRVRARAGSCRAECGGRQPRAVSIVWRPSTGTLGRLAVGSAPIGRHENGGEVRPRAWDAPVVQLEQVDGPPGTAIRVQDADDGRAL